MVSTQPAMEQDDYEFWLEVELGRHWKTQPTCAKIGL
jgi:hypothetical protein